MSANMPSLSPLGELCADREVRGGIRCLSEVEDAEDDEINETEDYYVVDEPQAILSSDEEMFDDSNGEDLADTGDEEQDVSDKGKSSVREEEIQEEAE
ncbi:hypothetical protein J4E80_008289 [Alternaria sp. BMP 0032]|nr:hypothetical protein J4E80_008289 [Alternaria sp. BMP 0032]